MNHIAQPTSVKSISKDYAPGVNGQALADLNWSGRTMVVKAYRSWDGGRTQVENYIADVFQKQHGAVVNQFMPLLITLECEAGNILAVAGLRTAAGEKLFLEQYMDFPIEKIVSSKLSQKSNRNHIAEIGNLASTKQGASRYLFVALTALLVEWDLTWLAFTGTHQVLNVFSRLGLNPVQVCRADPQRLESASHWGTYYDNNPQVMVGDVLGGFKALNDYHLFDAIALNLVEGESNVVGA